MEIIMPYSRSKIMSAWLHLVMLGYVVETNFLKNIYIYDNWSIISQLKSTIWLVYKIKKG